MKLKFTAIYTALFAGVCFSANAETNQQENQSTKNANLERIEVLTELEKAKAVGEKQKDIVNLSLLGRQPAFTSPIAVVNYDQKAFADKAPRNVVDSIAQIDASVMNFGGETNTISGVYVRNLQLDMRQVSVNGLAGLYSTYNSPIAAVASAQIIKGASTATTGMDPEGSAGASMNIETKRATDTPINKIGFGWFSNNRLQQSFDFARRFGDKQQWGVRINGLHRDGNTARAGYDEKAKEIAIGADYRGEKLRVGLDYMFNKRHTHGGRARVQDMQNLSFAMPAAPNGKINLMPRWSAQTTQDETIMATFEYDLPYQMMLSGGVGQMKSRYYGSFSQITMRNAQGDYSVANSTAMDFRARTTSANLKLQGEFSTGAINHYWNIAFDSVQRQRDHNNNPTNTRKGRFNSNIYNPSFSAEPTHSALQQATDTKLTARSLALADTIALFDEQLRLTLGGRLQWIKQIDYLKNTELKADRFSPMVTLAYVPNPDLVLYANYLEDLEPGNADPDTGEMNSPRVSRQIETGVRKNWGDQFTTTLSIYEISRPGIIRGNTQALKAQAGKEHGKERNRGVELNLYAKWFNNSLRTSLGVTYNQAKVIDFPTYADTFVNGVQVTSPRIISKAALEWDTPFVPNLSLNAAVQYYGKSYQDTAARYKLPAYTTVDLGAKYVLNLGESQQLTLRAGVENLFNKHYWQVQRGQYDRSFAVVGLPRTYWANMEYSF